MLKGGKSKPKRNNKIEKGRGGFRKIFRLRPKSDEEECTSNGKRKRYDELTRTNGVNGKFSAVKNYKRKSRRWRAGKVKNNVEKGFRKLGVRQDGNSFNRWLHPLGMTSFSVLV